jgi:argininosuccinate lyase
MSDGTRRFTGDTSDRRLLEVDIRGSIAHVVMLGKTGIISEEDASTLSDGLRQILSGAAEFEFVETDEDVHTAVERRLGELVGEVAGKLHTGRSRNDQVALDLRLYLKEEAADRIRQLEAWAGSLVTLAEDTADVLIPTYTHLQQAQTTSLGNHLLAYAWMAVRDSDRFRGACDRIDSSPLGAGASAGSSLPLDREAVAADLGLGGVVPNTLDAVGSRDFVSEYVFCCAQAMIHLSRLAEELVLWASQEFGWVTLSDGVSTGSSALPQKRNPDIAELVRGRAATVMGDTTSILALQKGLPLAYNRDFQEDKRIVFHANDVLAGSLAAMVELLDGVSFSLHSPDPGTAALPLAERLVDRGVPFREAHELVGRVVKKLEEEHRTLGDATADDLAAVDPRFEPKDLDALAPTPRPIEDQLSQLRDLLNS